MAMATTSIGLYPPHNLNMVTASVTIKKIWSSHPMIYFPYISWGITRSNDPFLFTTTSEPKFYPCNVRFLMKAEPRQHFHSTWPRIIYNSLFSICHIKDMSNYRQWQVMPSKKILLKWITRKVHVSQIYAYNFIWVVDSIATISFPSHDIV